ncbi:MAG: hypothetical protein AAB306_00815 [Pseudomonadota bacterium]
MRGQARGSPVLVQRAASEGPRWTRAVGDPLASPQGNGCRLAEIATIWVPMRPRSVVDRSRDAIPVAVLI